MCQVQLGQQAGHNSRMPMCEAANSAWGTHVQLPTTPIYPTIYDFETIAHRNMKTLHPHTFQSTTCPYYSEGLYSMHPRGGNSKSGNSRSSDSRWNSFQCSAKTAASLQLHHSAGHQQPAPSMFSSLPLRPAQLPNRCPQTLQDILLEQTRHDQPAGPPAHMPSHSLTHLPAHPRTRPPSHSPATQCTHTYGRFMLRAPHSHLRVQ